MSDAPKAKDQNPEESTAKVTVKTSSTGYSQNMQKLEPLTRLRTRAAQQNSRTAGSFSCQEKAMPQASSELANGFSDNAPDF